MYSKSLPYDTSRNIQSDLERSRRFGSGVYPDYSQASSSSSSRLANIAESRQVGSVSGNAVTANLASIVDGQNNSLASQPSSSTVTQPPVSYNLDLRNIISDLNTQDPFKAFILAPNVTEIEDAMYNAIACKDLPREVKEITLKWPSEQTRNLLGIISQDVLPEDMARLKRCFAVLKRVQFNSDEEPALGKDMTFLMQKYGKVALYRHVEAYTECCRKAWHYYNPGHTTNPPDHEIFHPTAEAMYKVIFHNITELVQPDNIWVEMVANGLFLKDTCRAVGRCLKIDTTINIPADSITETFASVYLNNNSSNIDKLRDIKITPCEGRDPPGFLDNLCDVICCTM